MTVVRNPLDAFRDAMRAADLEIDGEIEADGKLHRAAAVGDRRGRKDAWYLLHADGIPNGRFGHWARGIEGEWKSDAKPSTKPAERAEQARRIEVARAAAEAERRRRHDSAAREAAKIWERAAPAPVDHPYLVRKGVQAHGLRVATWHRREQGHDGAWRDRAIPGALLVPLFNIAGKLRSVQALFPEKGAEGRDKDYLPGGEKAGCHYLLGELVPGAALLVAEGYATAASLHECTGLAVAVAFDAGNLRPVAMALRDAAPGVRLVIAGDDDRATVGNPGATKAREAAEACGGAWCLPTFQTEGAGTDFNDLHQREGAEAVRNALSAALTIEATDVKLTGLSSYGGAEAAAEAPAKLAADRPGFERFTMTDDGLYITFPGKDGRAQPPRFIVEPFKVPALIRDHGGAGWGLLVDLRDPDGKKHRLIVPHASLKGDAVEALGLFMDRGCVPRLGTDRHLVEYLRETRPKPRARRTKRTGWHPGPAFVLPDGAIGDEESVEPVVFEAQGANVSQFVSKGTLHGWREHVAGACVGNGRLVFAVSAAFAAALLKPAGAENGGVHYRGGSSSGKTTLLRVAASVCGGPDFMARWRATDNGLEGMAYQRCDCPLLLDELSQMDPKSAGEAAYMLGNGSGKSRGNRAGGANDQTQFSTLYQSAGEVGLVEHMAEANRKTKAGQEIRLVEIPADAGAGLGCFEDLHGFANGAEFAKHLDRLTRQHHGTAWRPFVQRVIDHWDELPGLLREIAKRFEEEALTDAAEGQARRVAQRFALVAAAGELATDWGLTGWPEGESLRAAQAAFVAWMNRRGGEQNQEARAWLRQVRDHLLRGAEGRYADRDRSNLDTSKHAPAKSDRVGYRRVDAIDEKVEYYIFAETWRSVVCQGLDAGAVGRLLVDLGYAESGTEKDRPHLVKVAIPLEGRHRVVHVLPSLWDSDGD